MAADSGLFDVDENGDWMPATEDTRGDEYYEQDSNGDIQPK